MYDYTYIIGISQGIEKQNSMYIHTYVIHMIVFKTHVMLIISSLILHTIGFLCGKCRHSEKKGFSVLFNKCMSCGYINILLVVALSELCNVRSYLHIMHIAILKCTIIYRLMSAFTCMYVCIILLQSLWTSQ